MRIWAISDLHLSFGIPDKKMDPFGENWVVHTQKIASNWDRLIHDDDLILVAGDISWALHLQDSQPDLAWIDQRPGTKVLIKGNHDYWWESLAKVRKILPPSINVIQNDVFIRPNVSVAGARLWDSSEYSFGEILEYKHNPKGTKPDTSKDVEIFERELSRFEMSLRLLPQDSALKIAMTHYPPIGLHLQESAASLLCKKYGINIVVFGHLHSFKTPLPQLFGTFDGISYVLTSSDYLNFCPVQIA
jgi:hypothetical protein